MLVGKNVVKNKGAEAIVYDRVYLDFGPSDETENYLRTSEKKTIQIAEPDGKLVDFQAVRPKEHVSKEAPEKLMQAANDYLQAKFPTYKDSEGKEQKQDPWLKMLELAGKGLDQEIRNSIQADNRPIAAKDPVKAKQDIIRNLLASGIAKTQAAAEKMYSAMIAAEETDQAAA